MHSFKRTYGRKQLSLLAWLFALACFAFLIIVLAYPAKDILSSPTLPKALGLVVPLFVLLAGVYFIKGVVVFVEVWEKELIVGFPFGRERITGIKGIRVELPNSCEGIVHMAVKVFHSEGSTTLNFLNDFRDGKAMIRDIEKLSGTKAETFMVNLDGSAVKLAKSWQDS